MENAFTITKEIDINTSREDVFNALTDSNAIVNFFPLTEVISTWQVGAEVLYKGNVDGAEFTDFGIIEILDRPNEYRYRYWSDNHGTERLPENYLTIHYKLTDDSGGTKLGLEQSNLQSKEQFELMNNIVWDALLKGLKAYVEES